MNDIWGTDGEYEANLKADWECFVEECRQHMLAGLTFQATVGRTGGDPEDVAVALGYRNTTEAAYRLGPLFR